MNVSSIAKGLAQGFHPEDDAVQTVEHEASPQLVVVANALAAAIPNFVFVRSGGMKSTYQPKVIPVDDGRVEVDPGSPFWHWQEYGNATMSPHRPIQRAAESLNLAYTPE